MRFAPMLFAAALVATPALADHAGPFAGGGLTVAGPGTLKAGDVLAGFRLVYTRPDARSDATLSALAADGVDAHNSRYMINASAGLAAGLTHRLTLSAELPYVRRDRLREGYPEGGSEPLGTVRGVGDASLVAKYRLVGDGDGDGPGLSLIGGIKLPTGGTHARSPDGQRLETEHQAGTGSWDPIAGVATGVVLGPLRLAASALYQWSGKGAQDTRLGDRATGGVALSHHFGPAEYHDHDESEEHRPHRDPATWDAFAELAGEWEGRQAIGGTVEPGSGGKALWLTPGARFNASNGLSLTGGVGLPLWQRIRATHPASDYRLTLAVGKSF